jgi:hypothetical protein
LGQKEEKDFSQFQTQLETIIEISARAGTTKLFFAEKERDKYS